MQSDLLSFEDLFESFACEKWVSGQQEHLRLRMLRFGLRRIMLVLINKNMHLSKIVLVPITIGSRSLYRHPGSVLSVKKCDTLLFQSARHVIAAYYIISNLLARRMVSLRQFLDILLWIFKQRSS